VRRILPLFITLLFLFVTTVSAAGFSLKSINGVSTDGVWSSQWYHTDLQPTFSGDAPAGTEVKIRIDEQAYTTNANESGEWTWTAPSPLSAGDHNVVLENSGGQITFTLTLGEENLDMDKIGTDSGKKMPTVGTVAPTFLLLGSGLLLLLLPKLKHLLN
jgi:hypothetical protein